VKDKTQSANYVVKACIILTPASPFPVSGLEPELTGADFWFGRQPDAAGHSMSETCPTALSDSQNASSSNRAVEPPATSPSHGLDAEGCGRPVEIISAQRLLSSSSSIDEEITSAEQVPSVAYSQANGHSAAMDSPARHTRESQPLLGRTESDITFNHFPGELLGLGQKRLENAQRQSL